LEAKPRGFFGDLWQYSGFAPMTLNVRRLN